MWTFWFPIQAEQYTFNKYTHTLCTHLRSVQTDDSINIPGAVEEVGDSDSVFTCGNPILLGAWVDLEDVGPRTEDGLLSAQTGERKKQT